MPPLTSRQRAFLRGEAHHLKPILQIGAEGVSQPVLDSILEAFNTRELLKVKVLEAAPEKAKVTASRIAEALPDVHVPQTIGRTVVLYRPHPENPEIKLPR
jgi:RNA-binding protein